MKIRSLVLAMRWGKGENERENIVCTNRSNRPGRLCFEESVSYLIWRKHNCGEQGKIVTIHHTKILKKRRERHWR